MEKNSKVLLIDRDDPFFDNLRETLGQLGFSSFLTATKDISVYDLESLDPDFAVLGPSLDLDTCLRCLFRIKIVGKTKPILVFRHDQFLLDHPEQAPFDGVYGLPLDAGPDQISDILEKAFEFQKGCETRTDFPVLVGQGEPMMRIRRKILNAANKDVTVLITGESGTGKEMIARSIHYHSPRNKGPLVKISCGSLPDELLESEVFGYQRGAFTDAYKDKPGRLELAHGGTLFIDEIGDLSLSLQAKFLQVLEDKAFTRLGATSDHIIDMRVVAATNSDLWTMVRRGTFRKDLYYRLDVVNIEAPALRERNDDIPLLTHFFLNKYCFEYRKEPFDAPDEVIKRLMAYHWPGNVREFENVIRMAIALRNWDFVFKELKSINADDFAKPNSIFSGHSRLLAWNKDTIKDFIDKDLSLKEITYKYISEIEREAILKTLNETDWNMKRASEILRIGYKTFRNRISEFDLKKG